MIYNRVPTSLPILKQLTAYDYYTFTSSIPRIVNLISEDLYCQLYPFQKISFVFQNNHLYLRIYQLKFRTATYI